MRGYSGIALYRPKTQANIGAVLRAAGCFGVSFVTISEARYGGSRVDTQKADRHIPVTHLAHPLSYLPYGAVPIAVDLVPGAEELATFTHPARAVYVFGPEDGTLPPDVVQACARAVKVSTRFCMNLAAAVNVVLYDRLAKYQRRSPVGVGDA